MYQSSYKSMQSFLDNLPAEQINSSDDLAQVAAKQNSQEVRTLVTAPLDSEVIPGRLRDDSMFNSAPQRVMDDLKRKGEDMDRISNLSLDLQNLLNVRTTAAAI